MTNKVSFAMIALALGTMPLSAQIVVRNPTTDRVIVRSGGEVSRTHDKIPPGQLPPKGMCRVWIDGVSPGLQPPITDCATAERNRVANSRVIYGDRSSFPGKGKGKFKKSTDRDANRTCTFTDAVVVNGRVVDVCRDANGNVIRKHGKAVRRDHDDDDDDDNNNVADRDDKDHDDGDKFDKKDKSSKREKVKANKSSKKGKGHGRDG